MRPKRKAKPITIRLFLEEMERFEKVEARFLARHPLGDRNVVIRLWLGLPIKDPKAKLLEEEIDFLAGRIISMQNGDTPLIKGVTPALRLPKDRQREAAH